MVISEYAVIGPERRYLVDFGIKLAWSRRKQLIRSFSVGGYFVLSFAVLYWFAEGAISAPEVLSLVLSDSPSHVRSGICSRARQVHGLRRRRWGLRTASPLIAGAITGAGLASIPFWLYRGYGHWFLQGTSADISCFFAEGYGILSIRRRSRTRATHSDT